MRPQIDPTIVGRGTAVVLTVDTSPLMPTADEHARGIEPMLGTVHLGGMEVFGHRTLTHRSVAYTETARRRAQEETVAAFASALRGALGYDPSEVEGR